MWRVAYYCQFHLFGKLFAILPSVCHYCRINHYSSYHSADDDLSSVDRATLKQAYAAVITLILDAVKTDSDTTNVG